MVTKYRKTPLRLGEKDMCSFNECIFYSLLSIAEWYLKNKNEIKILLNPLKNSKLYMQKSKVLYDKTKQTYLC